MKSRILLLFVLLGIINTKELFSSQPKKSTQSRRATATSSGVHRKRNLPMQTATISNVTQAGRKNVLNEQDFVFFWQVPKDILAGKSNLINSSCLSQWYPAEFTIYNITFYSAEQFMMYCKARCFNDYDNAIAILETKNPDEVKKIGRNIKPFDAHKWDPIAHYFVQLGNVEKFRQNPLLKKYLLSTGNKILAEASPLDKVWGIGLSENDPRAVDQSKWLGKNKLGTALMAVRDQLRRVDNPYQRLILQSNQFTELITHIKRYGLQ